MTDDERRGRLVEELRTVADEAEALVARLRKILAALVAPAAH